MRKIIIMLLLFGLLPIGYVQASDQKNVAEVKTLVEQNTGYEVSSFDQDVEGLLDKPLSEEAAVKIALFNSPFIKAQLASLGISEADMREAGLLRNPTVKFSSRSSNEEGAKRNNEIEIKQDVLDVLFWPFRKREATARFKSAQYEAAQKITEFVKEIRLLYLDWVASQYKSKIAEDHFKAEEAALEISRRQKDAGNINDLQMAAAQAGFGKAKIEWLKTKQEVEALKERLRTMLALKSNQSFMDEVSQISDLPKENIDLKDLERQVIDQRLDLTMKRHEIKALEQSVNLAAAGVLPDFEVGYDQETESSGGKLKGVVVESQVPLFNRNQAKQMGVKAAVEVAKQQLEAMQQEDLLQVRLAYQNLMISRQIVETAKEIMPSYQQMVQETLYEYNFMLKDVFRLLESKQAELKAQEEYVEALKNYWASRVALEDALGAKIPFKPTAQVADKSKTMESEHHHGGHDAK